MERVSEFPFEERSLHRGFGQVAAWLCPARARRPSGEEMCNIESIERGIHVASISSLRCKYRGAQTFV